MEGGVEIASHDIEDTKEAVLERYFDEAPRPQGGARPKKPQSTASGSATAPQRSASILSPESGDIT